MSEILSQEEKIDYIYTTLKKNEKNEKIRFYLTWFYRITMLSYILYFFLFTIPSILDKIPSFSWATERMNVQEILDNPKLKGLYETYFQK